MNVLAFEILAEIVLVYFSLSFIHENKVIQNV